MTEAIRKWEARTGKIASVPGANYVRTTLAEFRHDLEAAVLDAKGKLSVTDLALIQSAARHEGRVLLIQRWLCAAGADAPVAERIGWLKEIGAATDSRDKAIEKLALDKAKQDTLKSLYFDVAALPQLKTEQDDEQKDDKQEIPQHPPSAT
ncbi:MAG: hypothetical protein AB7I37_18010 [Pirellulales bacterium]